MMLDLLRWRSTLLLTALNDGDFPHTRSCSKAAKMACRVYTLLGAAEAIGEYVHNDGHRMTIEGLEAADDWFDRWL